MRYPIMLPICILGLFLIAPARVHAETRSAKEIVRDAIFYWRDDTSRVDARMTITRPDWERSMELISWTHGRKLSLVRFISPAKDAGSASLKNGNQMWSYSPKINRVIKIPASMMSQSWMGSDFSYNDLARADEIIDLYSHTLMETKSDDSTEGKKVYIIESIPSEFAPVVWGKEVLHIRDDNIILRREFYDQDGALVKLLEASDIKLLDGKLYPGIIRMTNIEEEGEYTEIEHLAADFDLELSDQFFTLANLRNPRNEH